MSTATEPPTSAPAIRASAVSSTTCPRPRGAAPVTISTGVSSALVQAWPNWAVCAWVTNGSPSPVTSCAGKVSSGTARATPGTLSTARTASAGNTPGLPAATTSAAAKRSTGARVRDTDS